MSAGKPFQELLSELRDGSEDAARQIVDQYTDALVAVARKQMGAKLARRVDPEDIIQSTYRSLFVRVQNGEYELGGGKDLWKLMVTIALNKVRRKSKFHRASKRDMSMDQSLAADDMTSPARDAPAKGPTPDDAASLIDQLQTVLQGVPERDRAIVELRLQGCSTEEISDQTGRAQRSVRRVLQHLGQRLQKSIEE